MSGVDKAAARTVAVIVLVVLAAAALRGYLPGAQPAAAEPESSGPGALIPVAVMIGLSLAVIAVAIVRQARHPAARPAAGGDLQRDRGGERLRWTPRTLLILAAVAVVWLVTVLFLLRLRGWLDLPAPQPTAADPTNPAPGSASGESEPPPDPGDGTGVFGYLAVAAGVLIVLSVVATALGRRRPPSGAPPDDAPATATQAPQSGSQSLARAAERGLAEIGDLRREPREAIIACYAAMERELAKSPGAMPLDSDTPSEVLARAVERHVLRADSAIELVDLFEEARFSPHVMDEDHREVAVRVLQLVLDELQAA